MRHLKLLAPLVLFASAAFANKVVYTQNESTLDGRPFMPRGIYAVGVGDMPRAASYGFNVVQIYGLSGKSDKEVAQYMDAANRNGLKVLFTLGMAKTPSAAQRENMNRRVEQYKGHPALYGWYLADEPSVKHIKPQELEEIYNWIKATDPDHPVFSSNWELGKFKKACDVDMPQLYFGGASAILSRNAVGSAKSAARNGVQWVAIVNSYDAVFGDRKEPGTGCLNPVGIRESAKKGEISEEEAKQRIEDIAKNLTNPPLKPRTAFPGTPVKVRSQAFDMIAHGSNGIFYWLLAPETKIDKTWGYYTLFVHPELREALTATLHEMDTLWPRLANPAVNARTWREDKPVAVNKAVIPEKPVPVEKKAVLPDKVTPADKALADKARADKARADKALADKARAEKEGHVFYWCRAKDKSVTIIAVNESDADNYEAVTTIPELKDIPAATATLSGPEKKTLKILNGQLKDTFRANEARVYLIDLQ